MATTTKRKPAAKKATPKAKPLPIESGHSYFEVACQKVWLDGSSVCIGDLYGSNFEADYEEDYARVMLTMYELAHRAGIKTPANPYA